ncbi:Arm DNA-binding domain-containing protein [uncultured Bacteroides sp.]|uniref:Arm DNA-binding domain-containing protein n=1 Tax=uncultured Bacteroides sp. TaxID=162156 RepID=UPI00341C1240
MANLSLVIVPAKALKDRSHKIRVAVSHNGETRYIITDLRINSAKEFKNGQVIKRNDAGFMNTKLRSILSEYQKIFHCNMQTKAFVPTSLVLAQDYMEQAIDLKETNRTNRHIYFMKELYQDYFRLTLHDLQQ